MSLLAFVQMTASSSLSHGKVIIKGKKVAPIFYIGLIFNIILHKFFLHMVPMLTCMLHVACLRTGRNACKSSLGCPSKQNPSHKMGKKLTLHPLLVVLHRSVGKLVASYRKQHESNTKQNQ